MAQTRRLFPMLTVLLLALPVTAAQRPVEDAEWVGSWASAQQPLDLSDTAIPPNETVTVRQFVRLSGGGRRLRLRFSNTFGAAPLTLDGAEVALPGKDGGATIDRQSSRAVRFGGASSVTIPVGADSWSDPISSPVTRLASLAVTIRVSGMASLATGHIASHATSYLLPGDHLSDAGMAGAVPVEHWFALSGVAVDGISGWGTVVAFGDSITDGSHSTTNGNDRWPDRLAERLQHCADGPVSSVLNLGIGGNRVLLDGVGPNALARFDRDVLAQPNVRVLVLLEGVNDLGTLTRNGPVSPATHAMLVSRLTQAYEQMILRAHQHGIRVIGATILPFAGALSYHPDASNEADRQTLNRWIRERGHFDGVADFDQAVRDRSQPDRLLRAFDSGDHLHPSAAGYRAMGDAFPCALL